MSRKRQKLVVDVQVQGTLLLRVLLYWGASIATVAGGLVLWRAYHQPDVLMTGHLEDLWLQFRPALYASLLVLPFVLLDVLRMSHRIVGPFYRLRKEMQRLARGDDVESVSFRHNDFWREMALEFNSIAARLKSAERRQNAVTHPRLADVGVTDDHEADQTEAEPNEAEQHEPEVISINQQASN